MTPGEVVRIRVNPRDMMGVVDLMNKLEIDITGMSFSQATVLALSALLNTVREAGHIPTRDGFEFTQVMQPFALKRRDARKLLTAANIRLAMPDYTAALPRPQPVATPQPAPQSTLSIARQSELRRTKLRMDELHFKRHSGEIFSDDDEAEWTQLCSVLCDDPAPTNPPEVVDTGANS